MEHLITVRTSTVQNMTKRQAFVQMETSKPLILISYKYIDRQIDRIIWVEMLFCLFVKKSYDNAAKYQVLAIGIYYDGANVESPHQNSLS